LVANEQFELALEQTELAYISTGGKAVFIYYRSAILYMMKKQAEALLQLEMALSKSLNLVNKLTKFYPEMMHDPKVTELISNYKKGK
jgi:triphosphoribosyl-dephospho-CoA synthetase